MPAVSSNASERLRGQERYPGGREARSIERAAVDLQYSTAQAGSGTRAHYGLAGWAGWLAGWLGWLAGWAGLARARWRLYLLYGQVPARVPKRAPLVELVLTVTIMRRARSVPPINITQP